MRVSYQQLQKYENDHNRISVARLIDFYEAVGIYRRSFLTFFSRLHVQVCYFQRIILNKLAAWFNDIAHQRREHFIGLFCVPDIDL